MLGRQVMMQRMVGALTKPTPDNLQLVGARYAGKTVILHELARRLQEASTPYTAVVLWDLGHQTPETDELFMQRLARELSAVLRVSHADYAGHIQDPQGNPYPEIAEVLDALTGESGRVLLMMDGFDKPLSNGRLTRNLWDQLRELAHYPSLRFVTASRRTLRELIRNIDALGSYFWNIFDAPLRVGCFDDGDFAALLGCLPDLDLTAGAKTELWNASNGFPIIMLEILNTLLESNEVGHVSPEVMRAACDAAFPALRDRIDALWTDCTPSCRDLLRRVQEEGTLVRTGIANTDAEALIERGFVHPATNKLQRSNRLIEKYLGEQPNEDSAMARLFGMAEGYRKHFKDILEHRIAQITGMDPTLKHYLERCVGDLPDHPEVFMTNVRGIVDRAFEFIWKAELGTRAIPSGWMSVWKFNRERGIEDWQTTFPQGVHRVRLLNLMTGTDKSKRCARHVTKTTYVLMNAAHAFGDFGQHQEGAPVDPGAAYSALHLCIELAAALTRELPPT
jgi:hypothetical protein